MKEYTDSEILHSLKKRQSSVVRYLFNRYMPMIHRIVTKMGGTVENAKDVFLNELIVMQSAIYVISEH
ncbi:MAG: hypothetical protein ACQERS_11805 [Bacteroidota bacterium]